MRGPAINKRWSLVVLLCLILPSLVLWLTDSNRAVFMAFNAWSEWSPLFWSAVTLLGDTLVLFCLVLLFVGRRPDVVWSVILASLVVAVAVHIFKPFFDHPRPPAMLSAEQLHTIGYIATSGSFPSGHTAAAFTLAGVLCMLSFPRWLKGTVLMLAVLVAISRMAVGIHWPADVLGGAVIGWLSALLGIVMAALLPWGQNRSVQRFLALLLLLVTVMLPFSGDLGYPLGRPLLVILPLVVVFFALPGLRRLLSGGSE